MSITAKLTRGIVSVLDCRDTSQVHDGVRTSSDADHQEADQQNEDDGEVLHFSEDSGKLFQGVERFGGFSETVFGSQSNDFKVGNGALASVSRSFYTKNRSRLGHSKALQTGIATEKTQWKWIWQISFATFFDE